MAQRLWVIIVSSLRHYFHFVFFLGMFLLLPQHFLGFELLYQCGCYINIAGRKPVSRFYGQHRSPFQVDDKDTTCTCSCFDDHVFCYTTNNILVYY
jgi:hypothetical protein